MSVLFCTDTKKRAIEVIGLTCRKFSLRHRDFDVKRVKLDSYTIKNGRKTQQIDYEVTFRFKKDEVVAFLSGLKGVY